MRPIPDRALGDWLTAFCVGVIATVPVLLSGVFGESIGLGVFGTVVSVTMLAGIALRRGGAVRLEPERIVLVRWFVPVRTVEWSSVRSIRLHTVAHADADSEDHRQVRLVVRGGADIRLPLSFPVDGQHPESSAKRKATDALVREATRHGVPTVDFPG